MSPDNARKAKEKETAMQPIKPHGALGKYPKIHPPPSLSGPAQTTHQSISTLSSNSTAGKILLITSVIGDISHDVQEVNLSPLTPVLKDCIQKPENGRRLKHYIPSTTYVFESLYPHKIHG